MTMQQTRTCEKCGGTITAEEIIQRRAGLVEKKLLCVACVDALRRQVAMARAASAQKARDAEEQAAREAEEQAAREADERATREAEERAAREAEEQAEREAAERVAREAAELAARERAEAEALAAEEAALTALAAEAATMPALEEEEYTEAAAEEPAFIPMIEETPLEAAAERTHEMNGTRCLIFDAEPTSAGIAELQMRINHWLAEHPDAVVKSSSTTVGACDGAAGGTRFFVTMFF